MKTILVKAVILTDGDKYIIHGTGEQSAAELFKAVSPLWNFDPSIETAHYVELSVQLPEFEDTNASIIG